MLNYIFEKFKKIISKDWNKIIESWLWIYQYMKRYRFQIIGYTILGLAGTGIGLVSSVVSKNLIDAVTGYNTDSIGLAASMYVGLGVSRIFINMVTGKISLHIQTKVSNEISADVFDKVMCTDWESMSDYSTGDLLVRLTGDAGNISGNVLSFIPNMVSTFANFIGAFAIVCYHDPWMALLALGGAPVTVLTSRYRLEKMQKYQRESQQMSSKKMSFDQETFQNVQSIKAFGLIDLFSLKMRQIQKDAFDLSIRQYKYLAWSGAIMSLTGLAVSYSCYGFAVYRLWKGAISYGTMTLFVSMASSLTGSFGSVV